MIIKTESKFNISDRVFGCKSEHSQKWGWEHEVVGGQLGLEVVGITVEIRQYHPDDEVTTRIRYRLKELRTPGLLLRNETNIDTFIDLDEMDVFKTVEAASAAVVDRTTSGIYR